MQVTLCGRGKKQWQNLDESRRLAGNYGGLERECKKSNLAYALNTEMLNTHRRVAHKQNVQNIMFMYNVATGQVAHKNKNL